jgi:diacylglycerol kinase family enzyme
MSGVATDVTEADALAVLVVNGRAGTLSAMAAPRAALEDALRGAGFRIAASCAEDAPLAEQWAMVWASAARVVFVAGGDGTLRSAAAMLLQEARVMAPLPGGTMNRLCERLGLPAEPLLAAASYRPGSVAHIDIATVDGQVFLYECVVGAPTRLMRFREMHRGAGLRGWWQLLRAALREVLRPSSRALMLRIGRGGRRRRGHAVVVTLPPPGSPAGLSVQLARPRSALGRLRQGWRWFRGSLAEDPDVKQRDAARFVVHGAAMRLRLSLDGEMHLAAPPLRFRLHRGALPVLTLPELALPAEPDA